MVEINDVLWNDGVNVSHFTDITASYQSTIFEQYKLCVEMADRVSARRSIANTFFLTLHTGLLVFLGAWMSQARHRSIAVLVLLAALLVLLGMCATWWLIVRSYQQLNKGKFAVIEAFEERLPARAFVAAEWGALGEGRDWRVYLPLGRVERYIPLLFAAAYIVGFAGVLS